MAIKIDVQEFLEILNLTPPAQNIMLIGRHGLGKSQIITQFYQKKKTKVVAFFLGQMSDPGDLIGLMHKDLQTGHAEFLPPYWWPTDNKPIVLFLDELNRARPEILQSVQDLTLNKTLAGKKLPQGSIIISAVNEGDEYQLTDLDPALVSRFNLYEFAPTVEDWLLWATAHDIDERVTTFIQKNHHFLDPEEPNSKELPTSTSGLNKTPDRRAWEKVSNLIKPLEVIGDLHIKIIAGIVGIKAAMNFKKSLETTLAISPDQLLLNFNKTKTKLKLLKLKDLVLLNEQIVFWLNNSSNYKPEQKDTVLKNFHQYLVYLKKAKQTEAVAHIASMLESDNFQKVAGLLLVEDDILKELTEYIRNIKL